ncbi:MerR family transcriptional regulator [Jeongeupia sp. HS-3]|uniref:MerR family transcriptional regulator n=1 Tax=Jeongeupia sp. HS-3 TaxID=1009682 RepID=UPI0018A3BB76|nr:MerR family transcriptional regulator [Jeongeupia sp. HS-3]BCL74742.1 MerR family transcriptional regulator [Jeongeupia sp. HS-3]
MNISEFAATVGLSADTLRYYEKIGLIDRVTRNASGHRSYGQADLAWLSFLIRLRETGMPIEQMRRYAALRREGDVTLAPRRELLQAHAARVEAEVQRLQSHLGKLADKIALYRRMEADRVHFAAKEHDHEPSPPRQPPLHQPL